MPPAIHLETAALRPKIREVAAEFDLDPALIEAIALTESSGHPYAFRYEPAKRDASYGLMQVMGRTARNLGMDPAWRDAALCEPEVSLYYGCKALAENLDGYAKGKRAAGEFKALGPAPLPDSVRVALARYNGGARGNPYEFGARKGKLRQIEYVTKVEFLYTLVRKDLAGA